MKNKITWFICITIMIMSIMASCMMDYIIGGKLLFISSIVKITVMLIFNLLLVVLILNKGDK